MGYTPRPIILNNANKRHPKVPEPLPYAPMAVTVVAPRSSGKTALCCGLIKDVYRKAFSQIVIASPTGKLDPTFMELSKYKNIGVTDVVNNETLKNIFETQKSIFLQDPKSSTLLYVDDAGDYFKRRDAQKLMNILFTTSRHSNLHLIVCVQSLQHLSTIQKTNSTGWIVFKSDEKALRQLSEQLQSAYKSAEQVFEFLKDATKEKHTFAFIDFTASDEASIYRYGFN